MTSSPRTVPADADERPAPTSGGERVVLCDPNGAAIGTADKVDVHGLDTPLHLAFSCYVFDGDDRVLVTRRAYTKRTFPGVRTNSCCGHPAPGEAIEDAVRRRVRDELGLELDQLNLVLPAFRYRAVASDGTVENELCPVFRAVTTDPNIRPDPLEVADAWWVPWSEYTAGAGDRERPNEDPLSDWGQDQLRELNRLGPLPSAWPAGDSRLLPGAASWSGS